MKSNGRNPLALPMAFLIVFTLLAGAALAAEFEKEFTFDGKELLISNMIGAIKIKEGSSDAFQVLVSVRGEDASEGLLDFIIHEDGNALAIKFPLDEHTKYTYPPLGRNSSTSIHFRDDDDHDGSWLKKVFSGFGGKKITVKGKGNGLEMWADVTIEVPARHILEVRHGVGEIQASGLEADLTLDTHSGPISVENLQGDLLADTGSGRVEARAIKADKAKIDTGSGSVVLQLDRMGDGRFVIDTGSGSIELILPGDASARIMADTGSGSVRNKVDGADVTVAARDELEMTVGSGKARVTLDAGSGSITVRQE